jgi:hypothetical protein
MANHLKYNPATGHLTFGPNGHLAYCPGCVDCASIVGASVTFSGINLNSCVNIAGSFYTITGNPNQTFILPAFGISGSVCTSRLAATGLTASRYAAAGCAGSPTVANIQLQLNTDGTVWDVFFNASPTFSVVVFRDTITAPLCASPLNGTNDITTPTAIAHGGTVTIAFSYA